MADSQLALLSLSIHYDTHLEVAQLIINADNKNIYHFDIFIHAIFNRSLSIIFDYTSLIRQQNFIAAAPLIRLHIDTLLRLSASGYVNDPHDFAMQVMDGKRINKMKDISGAFMTDIRLVDKMKDTIP